MLIMTRIRAQLIVLEDEQCAPANQKLAHFGAAGE